MADIVGLSSAGKSLEDAFFAKENARLLEQMRAKAKQDERRKGAPRRHPDPG